MATQAGTPARVKPGHQRTNVAIRGFGAVVYALYVTVGLFIGLTFLGSVARVSATTRDPTATAVASFGDLIPRISSVIIPPGDPERPPEIDVVALWPDWAG